MSRKYGNSFWYRVGSAFENGNGTEGPLATAVCRSITLTLAVLCWVIPIGAVIGVLWGLWELGYYLTGLLF